MAKKLMSIKDFETRSVLSLYKNFSLFKEKYKNIMLTQDEWNSLFWTDPEVISYISVEEKYGKPRTVADI